MPTYLSPGVYIEEVSSGSAPIAGTSVAGFIGIFKPSHLSSSDSSKYHINKIQEKVAVKETDQKEFELQSCPDNLEKSSVTFVRFVRFVQTKKFTLENKKLSFNDNNFLPLKDYEIKVDYYVTLDSGKISKHSSENVKVEHDGQKKFELRSCPENIEKSSVTFVRSVQTEKFTLENKKLSFNDNEFLPPKDYEIIIDYFLNTSVSSGEIQLIANFTEFKQFFGDFGDFGDFTEDNKDFKYFAHAVYDFFRNGGTRAYVAWVSDASHEDEVLEKFKAIDMITKVVSCKSRKLGI